MERLQKIIASRGLCSRRQAEKWIEEGRVRVNGNTAHLGDTADVTEDVIEVDGKRLPKAGKKIYLMLNKPRGYVTTLSDEKGRKNAAQLVADYAESYNLERDTLWLIWTVGLSDSVKEAVKQAAAQCGFSKLEWVRANGVITTHGGPAAFGLAGFAKV